MGQEDHKAAAVWLLMCLLAVYVCGYAALRVGGIAVVFHYETGDRELWSNIDRIPRVGPVLQAAYLPLIHAECSLRHLEWSP